MSSIVNNNNNNKKKLKAEQVLKIINGKLKQLSALKKKHADNKEIRDKIREKEKKIRAEEKEIKRRDRLYKAAVKYIKDKKSENLKVSDKQCDDLKEIIYKPLDNYTVGRNEITGGTVSPSYILPIQGLQRLQKIMDEYVGGIIANYMTNDNLLKKGLELLNWLQEDLENIGAEDYHQLMRAWELKHRTLTSQCVTEHTLFREETRWPGYYYRGDKLKLDDENWHCLTVSRRDPKTGKFTMEKMPVYHIVGDEKEKKAS